jgi:hypothetical protein
VGARPLRLRPGVRGHGLLAAATVARVWHGGTAPAGADACERLLREEVFPGIAAKGVAGYRGTYLLRRPPGPDEVEFVTERLAY